MNNDKTIKIALPQEKILKETPKALQIELEAITYKGSLHTWKSWIPKSQIIEQTEDSVTLPDWIINRIGEDCEKYHMDLSTTNVYANWKKRQENIKELV